MQMKQFKKSLSLILCTMLIAAMALFTTGCGDNKSGNNTENPMNQQNSQAESQVEQQDSQTESQADEQNSQEEPQVLGEGEHQFTFTVTDADGKETVFEIHTDKTKVGEALLDLQLISGDEGDYGLYIKTVNGITADYDTDKTYWAFYVDGEYAMTGVDVTDITEGATYSFKVEK